MSYGSKQVGPHRYREDLGRYLEDFVVGDVYEHRPGRTITEADHIWFSILTMNTHPLHFDAAYARKNEFGRMVVNSSLILSLVSGMSVSDTSQKAIANLGWDKIRILAPVFAGDTLYGESQVIEVRESKSRPNASVVRIQTTGRKDDGTAVITYERAFMVPKRGHAVGDAANY